MTKDASEPAAIEGHSEKGATDYTDYTEGV